MTIEVEATREGASQDDSPEAIADMFLNRLKDAHGPSETDEEEDLETPENEDEAEDEDVEGLSEDEVEDEDEGTDEQEDAPEAKTPNTKKRVAADEDVVTVQVNGEDVEIHVRDLKRLAGQEKALTRKSEEASETKRKADERLSQYEASLNFHYQAALEAYAPYEGQNFAVNALANKWTARELEIVMEGEAKARKNLDYFHNELSSFHQNRQQEQAAENQRAVQATIAELSDPVKGIKGMGPDLIRELDAFATNDLGLSAEDLSVLVTRPSGAKFIKALHRLHSLERGQKALETKTKPVVKKPVKVIKSSSEQTEEASRPDQERAAAKAFKRSGSIDDALNLVMARHTRK